MPKSANTSKLPAKQARFVELYLVSLNATQAYREAYSVSSKIAEKSGPRLLGNVGVAKAIADAQTRRSARTEITQDMVLERLWELANADARELTEYRHTCCRHCYGEDFGYQLTQRELDQREADAKKTWENRKLKKPTDTFMFFDTLGGPGYDARKDPNPQCPECFGAGLDRTVFHDTRKLSSGAVRLFAGVKQTKDGIEFRMHDSVAALIKVGEHLGMFTKRQDGGDAPEETVRKIREGLDALRAVAA